MYLQLYWKYARPLLLKTQHTNYQLNTFTKGVYADLPKMTAVESFLLTPNRNETINGMYSTCHVAVDGLKVRPVLVVTAGESAPNHV